ncbi:MAG TPA: hypothetical protein EYN91_16700 [Candidatus Melainabacteria bacterium]|nr:hypothetical protein [Candidatus Melainabacteria bacterium]HIN65907.1 hypothetical protein [Candidatus Obscuribacterales bacterium]
MVQTAQQSEYTPERATAQPAADAASNLAVSETTKTWSAIASQIWQDGTSGSDATNANSKKLDFSVPKALSESLGFAAQSPDAQTRLENRGLLPRTRIAEAHATGQPIGLAVHWGDGILQRSSYREGQQTIIPIPNIEVAQLEREGRGRRVNPSERVLPPEVNRNLPRMGSDGALGKVYEHQLQNSTGRHKVDASVIIPQGYDPQRPTRMLIYNHGFRTDARAALSYSQLREQMRSADPQTILIVPEWQAKPGSNSSARGGSDKPNFYRNMFNEIMQKTPELRGKTVDDLASIGIISHSAGYNPSIAQLYKNGLQNKITSVTVLDSIYNPTAYDGWISNNLQDLAAGKKHFQLIYTGHLAKQSNALQARVEQQLTRAGLGTESVHKDHGRGGTIVSPETIANNGFVFKRSEFTNRGDGAHGSMTHVYLRQLLKSERRLP